MADSSIYGSTRELMAATDCVEKAGGGHSLRRRGILSRQRSSLSFDMGAKKIDQVNLVSEKDFFICKNIHFGDFP